MHSHVHLSLFLFPFSLVILYYCVTHCLDKLILLFLMSCFKKSILQSIHFHAQSWLPARSIIVECLAARKDIDPSGEIMVLKKSCPVSEHAGTDRLEQPSWLLVYQNLLSFIFCHPFPGFLSVGTGDPIQAVS